VIAARRVVDAAVTLERAHRKTEGREGWGGGAPRGSPHNGRRRACDHSGAETRQRAGRSTAPSPLPVLPSSCAISRPSGARPRPSKASRSRAAPPRLPASLW